MIATVSLNPAVDKQVIVQGFRAGSTNRVTVDRVDVGGKGINVALNLKRLGCEVIATGFVGGDDRYGVLATLTRAGVNTDFVTVPGETRVNLKVTDTLTGVETELNEPGFTVSPQALADLIARLSRIARRASVIVFSGSLPPEAPADFYAQLIPLAKNEGVLTVLDTAGPALAHGVSAGPDLAKPNRAEAEELIDACIVDEATLVTAARRILGLGARRVVVSLGGRGALSASAEGICRAHPPTVPVRSTVGAGDAMVAALAYGLEKSLPAPDVLRLATAVSCAAVASAGQSVTPDHIEALLPRVSIAAVEPPTTAHNSPAINR